MQFPQDHCGNASVPEEEESDIERHGECRVQQQRGTRRGGRGAAVFVWENGTDDGR